MNRKRMISALAIALAALTSHAVSAEPSEFDWSSGLARNGAVAVENAHGDIFVEQSDDKGVAVRAIVRDDKPIDAAKWVHVVHEGDKITVCVGYASSCTPGTSEPSPVAGAPHIDVAIFLPEGADIAARAADGQVAVEYATGSVLAATDKGDIHVSTAGNVSAASHAGTITIDEPKGAKLAITAKSDTGSVKNEFAAATPSAPGGTKIEAHSESGNVVIESRT